MKPIVTFSQCALRELYKHISSNYININKNHGIFFYLNSGGCNGFTYQFDPVDKQPKSTDIQIEYINSRDINLPIYICKKSQMFILGTHIQWKKDIMGYRFSFDNPLAKNQCGCKTSFNI